MPAPPKSSASSGFIPQEWTLVRYWLVRDPQVRVFSRDAWLVLAITLVWYAIAYALNDAPDWNAGGNPGWLVWWDQGQYHKQAADLAHGELKPNVYWFGYPALGAVFYHLLPRQPFLVPDLVMVLAIVAVFYAAARLYVSRLEALLLVYVFIWFDSLVRDECLVIPWNTLPAYTAFFVSIYLLILRPAAPRLRELVGGALLMGLAALARPTEIAALGLVYLPALFRLRRWGERAMAAGLLAVVALGVVALLVSVNEYEYHALKSPYMAGESGKINPANYGLKAYQFFMDSVFLTGEGTLPQGTRPPSLFSRYPEFLFALPGLLFLARARGWAATGLILPMAFTVGLYLLYVPFDNPPYAWSYGQWHYLAWIFPWLGLASYLTFRRAVGVLPQWEFLTTLLLPLVATCVIGFAAAPSGWATLSAGDGLQMTTNAVAGTFQVKLKVLRDCRAEDVRLVFRQPPPFNGTEVSTQPRLTIAVNGKPQVDMIDCMTSQENATYHFTFLAHGLALHAGDEIEIHLRMNVPLAITRAELATVRFAPFQAWRDNLAP